MLENVRLHDRIGQSKLNRSSILFIFCARCSSVSLGSEDHPCHVVLEGIIADGIDMAHVLLAVTSLALLDLETAFFGASGDTSENNSKVSVQLRRSVQILSPHDDSLVENASHECEEESKGCQNDESNAL